MIQLEESFNIEGLRQRLRRMDDAMLLRWGQAAAALSTSARYFACKRKLPATKLA
jgi:hypothetical protein